MGKKKYTPKAQQQIQRQQTVAQDQTQENKQPFRKKITLKMKDVLFLWARKIFPSKNELIKLVIIQQQMYIQGQQDQVHRYIRLIQKFEHKEIKIQNQISLEKIQYQLLNIHDFKLLRSNIIKIAIDDILTKHHITQFSQIKKDLFGQGQFFIASYQKIGKEEVQTKIKDLINQQNIKMGKSRIQQYQPKQQIRQSVTQKKKYRLKNSGSKLINEIQTKQAIENNEIINKRGNRSKLSQVIYQEKLNLKYFNLNQFKNWVQNKRYLKFQQFKFENLSSQNILVTLECQKQSQQKLNELKSYMQFEKIIVIQKWQQRSASDIIDRYENIIKIKYIKGYKPQNLSQYKLKQLIDNNKIEKNTINTVPFSALLLIGIKPQVQRIQTEIKQILRSLKNEDLKDQVFLELGDLQEFVRQSKTYNLIEKVLEKQIKDQEIIKQYKIMFANKQIVVKLTTKISDQNKLQGFKKRLLKFLPTKIKVKKQQKKKFSSKIIEKYKQKIIIIEKSDYIYFIEQENKITDIIHEIINQATSFNQQIIQKTFKFQQCKFKLVKQKLQKIKQTEEQYKNFTFVEKVQNPPKINIIGPTQTVDFIEQTINTYLEQLQASTAEQAHQISQSQIKLVQSNPKIFDQIEKQFKVHMFLRPNVDYGAKIKIDKRWQIDIIKGVHHKLKRIKYGTVFIFSNKKQIQNCKDKYLQPFKLRMNSKQNNHVKYQDQHHSFIYQQDFKPSEIIPLYNQLKKQCQNYKIGLFMPQNQKKEFIKTLIQCLLKTTNKNGIITILQNNQDEDLERRLDIKIIKGIQTKKRWFTSEKDQKYYYNEQGCKKINQAIQKNQKQVNLNNSHLQLNINTHSVNLKDKNMLHLRSHKIIPLNIQKNQIKFQINGQFFKFPQEQFIRVCRGVKQGKDPIEVSIGVYKIDLIEKKQINLFSGFTRNIEAEVTQVKDQFQGKIEVNYDLKVNEIIFSSQNAQTKTLNKAWIHFKNYLNNEKIIETLKLKFQKINSQTQQQIKKFADQCNIQYEFASDKSQIIMKGYFPENLNIFKTMVEILTNINVNQGHIIYPKYWQIKQQKQIQVFDILQTTQQFQMVQRQFKIASIKSLQRIQNKMIYKKYFDQKLFLKGLNDGKQVKQSMLYHGTRKTQPSLIYNDKEEAFNINYTSDRNLLGKGIYFAEKADYSNNYAHTLEQHNNAILNFLTKKQKKQMFYCLVLVGQSQICSKHDSTIKDTNYKNQKKIRYQSMTDFLQGSNVYVVYKNRRAYPLYLITY